MRRVGNLWPDLTSFANLLEAAEAAAAGKRKRPDVAAFLLNLEPELIGLHRELLDGSYQPGPYRTFTILDPKPRQISAAVASAQHRRRVFLVFRVAGGEVGTESDQKGR